MIRQHSSSGKAVVPPHLRSIVDLVIGLDMLPVVRAKKVRTTLEEEQKNLAATRYDFVYQGDISRVYNIPSSRVTNSKTTQSVIEFWPEGAPLWQDLQIFSQWSSIPFSNISTIIGPFETDGQDGESLLDVQLITATAHTPVQYITIPDGWSEKGERKEKERISKYF